MRKTIPISLQRTYVPLRHVLLERAYYRPRTASLGASKRNAVKLQHLSARTRVVTQGSPGTRNSIVVAPRFKPFSTARRFKTALVAALPPEVTTFAADLADENHEQA